MHIQHNNNNQADFTQGELQCIHMVLDYFLQENRYNPVAKQYQISPFTLEYYVKNVVIKLHSGLLPLSDLP